MPHDMEEWTGEKDKAMTTDKAPSPDVGRLIEQLYGECAKAEGIRCPDAFKRENWCTRCQAADALAALQARETEYEANAVELMDRVGRWMGEAESQRQAREAAEARETTLRLERDSAREQFDKHVEWAAVEVEALRQAQARLKEALVGAAIPLEALAASECDMEAIALHDGLKTAILSAVRQIRVALASVDPQPVPKET